MLRVRLEAIVESVTVEAGQLFAAVVDENPTTGYRWEVEAVTGPLTVVSSEFEAGPGATPGRGGQRTIVARADGRGEGELLLRSARSWEAPPDAARRRLAVVVK